jgi:hypothetical protein
MVELKARWPDEGGTALVSVPLVLIGGRPLSDFPRWVRLLVILALVSIGAPLVRPAISSLHVLKASWKSKMTAEQTAAALPRAVALDPG